jgi:cystathionine beta-lyase family protein involved in aluminum resistance
MNDNLLKEAEIDLQNEYQQIDDICLFNSAKIIKAFHKEKVNASDFNGTTGYGYGDTGRDKIERIYADIFNTEDALVRREFISGTHAISTCFFALLRPNDFILSITGKPYDTLWPVIGLTPNKSSLASFNIHFKYIDLINNDFDYDNIKTNLDNIKLVHIQRSIGYSTRETVSISKLEKVIKFIKEINPNIIIMVDNCYCELCSKKEPTDVGADVTVGSLIKNLGAGIASNGAYITGKKELIELCAERLTSPGLGKEVGPSLNQNKSFLEGIYLAPAVVSSALKVKRLTAYLMNKLNIETINNDLNDIVLGIVFNDEAKLIKYTQSIQKNSAIDSEFKPLPSNMPGYDNKIIMASGSFTDGSSIELSCDGPLRKPYIAYQQGSLTYEYGKIAVVNAIKDMLEYKR